MKWSKDGELLHQGDRVKLLDNAVSSVSELHISHVTVEDSGVYSAEATNVHGTVQTNAVVRVVEYVQKTSEDHHKTSVVENITKTVEELYRKDTEEVSIKEGTLVVRDKKEKMEKEETQETREEMHEITTERVEVISDSGPLHQPTVAESEQLREAEVFSYSEELTTRSSMTDYAETKVSEVTKIQQEDAVVKQEEIPAPDDKSQSSVFAVGPEFLKVEVQETAVEVSGDETMETVETLLSAAERKSISYDVLEEKGENVTKLEREVQEVSQSHSLVEVEEKSKLEEHQDIIETSEIVDQVSDTESQVNLQAKDSTSITAAEQSEATKEKEVIDSSKEELEGPLPVLKTKPVPTTVQEGEVLRLVCEVAEQPQVEITWLKDGKKLETAGTDARIRMAEDKVGGIYLLEIAETTTEDIGEYTLSVRSEGDVVSCTVSVSVISKLEPEVPLSTTVSEQTSLSTALFQASETSADATGTLELQETEPPQSVIRKPDVEEIGQQEENIVVADVAAVTLDHEVVEKPPREQKVSAIGEKFIQSGKECEEVRKDEAEVSMETVSETSKVADVKTIASKETVTKERKKSKGKQEETGTEIVDITENVEELEEKILQEVKEEDALQKEVAAEIAVKETKADDKTTAKIITVVEDTVVKNATEESVAVDVEQIVVEYSEEEFEGPLPVIEVKPVPISVNANETVRLLCKVAEEPAAQVYWSKNGQKLEATSENKKIHMGVDVETGMHFLEIAEATLEDIGEYTLTAESEGGIVSCTVSVDVVSELETSTTLKQTSQKMSEEVAVEDALQKEVTEEIHAEERKVDDKTATEVVTVVEDTVVKNVTEETVAADVEEIVVEYSEEEFEGPLPVIEVKPVPTSVKTSETVRLVCKFAEEPAAQVYWSKNGEKLEATSENKKIHMGVDAETRMHFLEIAEATLEDIGEYTLTAESEGGIVSCTVSVDVVSELEASTTLKQTSQKISEQVMVEDTLQKKVAEEIRAEESVLEVSSTETSQSVSVRKDVEQFKPLEQSAVESEVAEITEPLDKTERSEVESSELPRAAEAAPVFISVPQPVSLDEGSAVCLQCQVEG